jgi:hypothetical protein
MTYDSSRLYYSYQSNVRYPIGFMSVSAIAIDAKTYTFEMPGLCGPTAAFEPEEQYGLWAFRKSEQLSQTNLSLNADSIRWLGQDRHIITRQTSLLALEPGMELWKDTLNPENPSSGEKMSVDAGGSFSSVAPNTTDPNSISGNMDGISIDELIARKSPVLKSTPVARKTDMTLGFSKAGAMVAAPYSMTGNDLTISLFSLQGRLLATKHIRTTKGAASTLTVRFGFSMMYKGMYIIKAKIGSVEKMLSVPVF